MIHPKRFTSPKGKFKVFYFILPFFKLWTLLDFQQNRSRCPMPKAAESRVAQNELRERDPCLLLTAAFSETLDTCRLGKNMQRCGNFCVVCS